MPEEGETLQYENLHFEVLTMDNNQIKRVRVVKEEEEEED
ncbi:transporter associated domain-containing protein [Marinococcus halophilus]